MEVSEGHPFACQIFFQSLYLGAFACTIKTLKNYKADVDTDAAYTPDTEVVADGYFHESEFRSAPYFDIDIDGITIK